MAPGASVRGQPDPAATGRPAAAAAAAAHAAPTAARALAGRLAFRHAFDACPDIQLCHINEPTAIESTAYLLKYDSVHGGWAAQRLGAAAVAAVGLPPTHAHAHPRWPAGTWQHDVEAVDGKIVITRKNGSQATLTYSEASSPGEVRSRCTRRSPPCSVAHCAHRKWRNAVPPCRWTGRPWASTSCWNAAAAS